MCVFVCPSVSVFNLLWHLAWYLTHKQLPHRREELVAHLSRNVFSSGFQLCLTVTSWLSPPFRGLFPLTRLTGSSPLSTEPSRIPQERNCDELGQGNRWYLGHCQSCERPKQGYAPGTCSMDGSGFVGRRELAPQGGALRRQTRLMPSSVRIRLTWVWFHAAAWATRQSNTTWLPCASSWRPQSHSFGPHQHWAGQLQISAEHATL